MAPTLQVRLIHISLDNEKATLYSVVEKIYLNFPSYESNLCLYTCSYTFKSLNQ